MHYSKLFSVFFISFLALMWKCFFRLDYLKKSESGVLFKKNSLVFNWKNRLFSGSYEVIFVVIIFFIV